MLDKLSEYYTTNILEVRYRNLNDADNSTSSRQSLLNVEVKEAPGNKQTPMEIASGDSL